jgi:hypothetical protein
VGWVSTTQIAACDTWLCEVAELLGACIIDSTLRVYLMDDRSALGAGYPSYWQ